MIPLFKSEDSMGLSEAKKYLEKFNLDSQVLEFDQSSATVLEAALALNTDPKHIAKTLAFKVDEAVALICAAGDAKVDNAKYKAYFGLKAKMLSPEELIELVGHPMGGVCPFGVKETCTVYLDESLKRFEHVFPACGSGNSAIKMNLDQLERISKSKAWIDVCKDWQ